jgi:hypothetical protein
MMSVRITGVVASGASLAVLVRHRLRPRTPDSAGQRACFLYRCLARISFNVDMTPAKCPWVRTDAGAGLSATDTELPTVLSVWAAGVVLMCK